ncbi:MAG: acetoin utilization protein AcuC [Anaerolineae bacterium]
MSVFICSEDLWARGHGRQHPLKPERLKRTWEMLQAYRAFDGETSRVVPPRPAMDDELCLFHTPDYVAAVRCLGRGEPAVDPARYNFGPGDNPIFPGMFQSESLKVGAALVGVEWLLTGQAEIAFSFAGGLHHARPDQASGFCVFNDPAIAIHRLLDAGLRVAYVDIDAHHGDGVQAAFYDTDRVLTISLHETGATLFPSTGFMDELGKGVGYGYSVNFPFPPYTDDEPYLEAFRALVPPLVRRFAPDVVISQLGCDTHWRDPLSHVNLTTHAYEAVVREIKSLAPRWLALGGGGYDLTVVPRAWTLAYGVMLDRKLPDELPLPWERSEGFAGYELGRLHDQRMPFIAEDTRQHVRKIVAAQINYLRQELDLSGS